MGKTIDADVLKFAEKLISRIQSHKENVRCYSNIGEGYALAHDHIIAIIEQELRWLKEVKDE